MPSLENWGGGLKIFYGMPTLPTHPMSKLTYTDRQLTETASRLRKIYKYMYTYVTASRLRKIYTYMYVTASRLGKIYKYLYMYMYVTASRLRKIGLTIGK